MGSACVPGGIRKSCVYCQHVRLWPTLRRDCCGKGVHHEVKVGSPPTVYLNTLHSCVIFHIVRKNFDPVHITVRFTIHHGRVV